LNASTHLDCAAIVRVAAVVEELDVLEIVGPQQQGTLTGGTSKKTVRLASVRQHICEACTRVNILMASILDHQANVLLLCELDPGRYIVCVRNVDRVLRDVAVHAASVLAERAARVVEPVRILDGRWVSKASVVLAKSAGRSEADTHCGSGMVQVAWMLRHATSSYNAP
jgi:hypothetical protein